MIRAAPNLVDSQRRGAIGYVCAARPESVQALTVLPEGRIAGDRALAFRFADSGLPPTAWSKKYGFAVLVNAVRLTRMRESELLIAHPPARYRLPMGVCGLREH